VKTAADANMAYDMRMKRVKGLLKDLERLLYKHEMRQGNRMTDWSFVGDLEHTEEDLTGILRFLGSGGVRAVASDNPLESVMAMKDSAFVPRETVAKLCSSCAEKMERDGLKALRAGFIKGAVVDCELRNATQARHKS